MFDLNWINWFWLIIIFKNYIWSNILFWRQHSWSAQQLPKVFAHWDWRHSQMIPAVLRRLIHHIILMAWLILMSKSTNAMLDLVRVEMPPISRWSTVTQVSSLLSHNSTTLSARTTPLKRWRASFQATVPSRTRTHGSRFRTSPWRVTSSASAGRKAGVFSSAKPCSLASATATDPKIPSICLTLSQMFYTLQIWKKSSENKQSFFSISYSNIFIYFSVIKIVIW